MTNRAVSVSKNDETCNDDYNELADFTTCLQFDFFLSEISQHLSFNDLRSLSTTNHDIRLAIRTLLHSWPNDISHLLQTWCGTTPTNLFLCGIHSAARHDSSHLYRNPAPLVQFTFGDLIYHRQDDELRGNPWSEIPVENLQPPRMGREQPMACAANDDGSEIFYCGGLHPVTEQNGRWLNKLYMLPDESSSVAGMFDVRSGLWQHLPRMPSCRKGSGICRIGERIYIIGGEDNDENISFNPLPSVLCFDLDQWCWMDSGCDDFPGEAHSYFAVSALDEFRIVVAGGEMVTERTNIRLQFGQSREVFCLNVASGEWTQLADLPEDLCNLPHMMKVFNLVRQPVGYTINPTEPGGERGEPSFVIVCGDTWARLLPSGEWEVNPDLRGAKLAAIQLRDFGSDRNRIFTGNSWRALPPDGPIYIDDMKFFLNDRCRSVRMH